MPTSSDLMDFRQSIFEGCLIQYLHVNRIPTRFDEFAYSFFCLLTRIYLIEGSMLYESMVKPWAIAMFLAVAKFLIPMAES